MLRSLISFIRAESAACTTGDSRRRRPAPLSSLCGHVAYTRFSTFCPGFSIFFFCFSYFLFSYALWVFLGEPTISPEPKGKGSSADIKFGEHCLSKKSEALHFVRSERLEAIRDSVVWAELVDLVVGTWVGVGVRAVIWLI